MDMVIITTMLVNMATIYCYASVQSQPLAWQII